MDQPDETEFIVGLPVEHLGSPGVGGNSESSEEIAGSSGAPLVSVMESTDFGQFDH